MAIVPIVAVKRFSTALTTSVCCGMGGWRARRPRGQRTPRPATIFSLLSAAITSHPFIVALGLASSRAKKKAVD